MVSIVIVARDLKDKKLRKCYESIKHQTYRGVIQVITETKGNIKQARVRGVCKAKGEYICFVDSDQVLSPRLIQDCVRECRSGWDGVTWVERALNPATFCEMVIDYDKQLFHNECDDDPIKGAAEPRFFKAKFVHRINWDKLPPITFELSAINKQINDMGARIKFIDTCAYHHEPHTFRELFSKFFRYGYYYIPSLKYNKELVLNHSKPRRVYFTSQALRKPLLYVGLWYHYLVKAVAASGGAVWYLIKRY